MDEESPWTENEYPEEYQKDDGSTGTRIVNRDAAGAYSWVDASPAAAPAVAAPSGPDMWARPEGGRGYPEKRDDGSTWWVNQDTAGNYTQKPWQQPAPVSQFAQWAQEFTMVHGREPQAKDYQDKVWMDEFVAKQGRFPTREEWVRNWYAKKPAQRNYEPEFVPFKSIGGPGGWQKEWGAPQAWNSGEDWNSAFERVGFGAQQAAPENRANSLATQRLIGSSMNYADYQTKADAILSFLKQFEKPVETKAAEETAAAKGGPAGGGAPRVAAPVGIQSSPELSRQMRGEQMQAAGKAYAAAGMVGQPGADGVAPPPQVLETGANPLFAAGNQVPQAVAPPTAPPPRVNWNPSSWLPNPFAPPQVNIPSTYSGGLPPSYRELPPIAQPYVQQWLQSQGIDPNNIPQIGPPAPQQPSWLGSVFGDRIPQQWR